MDEAHFSDLDLEGCAKVQTRADFEAKCSAIGDYIEGRVSEEVREDQPSGDSVSRADVDRCKEDRGCVLQYRSGQGNVPNGHEFAARYAFLVARCTVVLDGSHSCDELAGVIQNGGWGGCIGSVCYRGGRTEIYKLSAAERDVGMAALNVAGPKLDDAAWAELEASGDLAKCKTPTTSADCDSVARYASAFAQGHHSLDATALLQSSERTRKRLHVSECQAEQNALSKEAGAFARMPSVTGSGCYQYCRALGVADASCYSRCDMSGVGEAGAQLQEHARRITQSCDCKKGVCH